MAQRVFVKVVGFTDVERHALNTMFRLSEQRDTVYCLWLADAPEEPQLALIDEESYEAPLELESPKNSGLKLIWVGEAAPDNAWRRFDRPISWPDVVRAMDEVFEPPGPLDFDLEFGDEAVDTLPPEAADTLPPDEPPAKRALIASPDGDLRLYLRAKLALAEMPFADEADTGAQALERTRAQPYAVALVDLALPDCERWAFLKDLTEAKPAIPHVILIKEHASVPDKLRAWFAGADACFDKPPDPAKLHDLLLKVSGAAEGNARAAS